MALGVYVLFSFVWGCPHQLAFGIALGPSSILRGAFAVTTVPGLAGNEKLRTIRSYPPEAAMATESVGPSFRRQRRFSARERQFKRSELALAMG